jgi:L-ascorbate metabolism protein UlaG (beta-lactamase superfamily)
MSNHETVSKALARPNVFDFVFLMLKLIGPRTVIPMHYATFPLLADTSEAFGEELKKRGLKTELRVMNVGETITV